MANEQFKTDTDMSIEVTLGSGLGLDDLQGQTVTSKAVLERELRAGNLENAVDLSVAIPDRDQLIVQVSLTASETADLALGKYFYDIQIVDDSTGTKRNTATSEFTVNRSIT